jgi:hypothetical protein
VPYEPVDLRAHLTDPAPSAPGSTEELVEELAATIDAVDAGIDADEDQDEDEAPR